MSRQRAGEILFGTLAFIATVGATAAAVESGGASLFADVFGLAIMLWLVRGQYETRAAVKKDLADLKDTWTAAYDRIIDRATTVVAEAEVRTLAALDNESDRRHQLRKEFEANRDVTSTRLASHAARLTEIGAALKLWPRREPRDL